MDTKKYNLWNRELTLPNKTKIKYNQLTIPCCKTCNNTYLSNLEKEIKKAVEGGYEEFSKLDDIKIFQWTFKIYYGLLYKELFLDKDRKKSEDGKLMTDEELYRFKMLHICFQSLRVPMEFKSTPWSVFVFKTYKYEQNDFEEDYFYADSKIPTVVIRMSGIGIIVAFGENGTQKMYLGNELEKYRKIELHPIQFNEIYSYISYTRLLIESPSTYVIADSKEKIQVSMAGVSSNLGLEKYDVRVFAGFLYHVWNQWGFTQELIFYDLKRMIPRTYLLDENKELQILPKNSRFIDPKFLIKNSGYEYCASHPP